MEIARRPTGALDTMYAFDLAEVADDGFQKRDPIQRRKLKGRIAVFTGKVVAHEACEFQVAIDPWQHA